VCPLFTERGYVVLLADVMTELSPAEVARQCCVVILSVPIGVAGGVIKQVGPLVAPDGVLMDLTSLKGQTVMAMLTHSQSEVVGIHPLFGPDLLDIKGQNVILCSGRGEKWHSWIRELFTEAGAIVTETTPDRHDEMMAYVQGLNHLDTILWGLTIREAGVDISDLMPFSTPLFRAKWALVERVFSQSPLLYAELLVDNPALLPLVHRYQTILGHLVALIQSGDKLAIRDLLAQARLVPSSTTNDPHP